MNNAMTTEQRIELAEKVVAAMAAHPAKSEGRIWSKGSMVRVYTRKGFISIREDGVADVSAVGGHAFQEGMAMRCREAGLTVAAV